MAPTGHRMSTVEREAFHVDEFEIVRSSLTAIGRVSGNIAFCNSGGVAGAEETASTNPKLSGRINPAAAGQTGMIPKFSCKPDSCSQVQKKQSAIWPIHYRVTQSGPQGQDYSFPIKADIDDDSTVVYGVRCSGMTVTTVSVTDKLGI